MPISPVSKDLGSSDSWTKILGTVSNQVVGASQKIAACVPSPRLVRKVLAFILLLFVLTLLSGYAANFYAHYNAEKLLLQIRTLDAGKTSVDEANRIFQHFGGEEYDARSYYSHMGSDVKYLLPNPCLGDDPSYAINIRTPRELLWAIEKIPELQHFGWHPWYVGLMIHHKNRKVTCYSQIVGFVRPDGQEVGAEADLDQRNPESLVQQQQYEANSFISRHLHHETHVRVLSEASDQEKRRAFSMDLTCTISLRGCVYPCEIFPLGWLDTVHDHESRGSEMPEGANDPRCPAH
jgi:hypothetical protein